MTPLLAGRPFELHGLRLRNRLVGTPHAPGYVEDGLPVAADAEYWRRAAAGGAAMLTVGGTVVAPESTYRRPNLTHAWRREAIPGQALRAEAIRSEGAIAACQLVHLGRETLGAETWFHPVAPSAVRSPREPTRPRALTNAEIDGVVEAFTISALNAVEAGFEVIELHAAHGYLLGQFLSAATNLRSDARSAVDRLAIILRIVAAIRSGSPDTAIGIRLSTDGGAEAGLTPADLAELLPRVSAHIDYVNLTVGMRTTYVRDMATTTPPLRDDIAELRSLVDGPLLISHGFRSPAEIERALSTGADLIGMARALIADPQTPKKLLSGRAAEIRPCVACNEDCRAFDPVLLCSVNPDLAPRGSDRRPAAPYLVQQGGRGGRRVAVVGAGPAGLECALTLGRAGVPVVVFDARETLGGQLAVAAAAPNRSGWRSLLSFYAAGIATAEDTEVRLNTSVTDHELADFDDVVLAIGSREILPEVPGIAHASSASDVIGGAGPAIASGSNVVVADDGFGWWPCVSAVEVAVRAGAATITVLAPGPAFAGGLPPEARVQLLARLAGTPVEVRTLSALTAVADGQAVVKNVLSNSTWTIAADSVIAVGERRSNDGSALVVSGASVWAIGDMVVPRRAAHAIAEGRAVAERLIAARTPTPA